MSVKMNRVNTDDPCGIFANGKVEDYAINITASAEESFINTVVSRSPQDEDETPVSIINPNPFNDRVNFRFLKLNS